jgi:hypothetical protein
MGAAPLYTTGFEPPEFTLGDVAGQDGWGHVSNSPTGGVIEPVPAGSPAETGTQSLAIRTRNVDFFGVQNHLFSALIDPPAGETGSTAAGVLAVDPRSHFEGIFWFRTPSTPLNGRFAELNPSSKASGADQPANRYAQVRLFGDAGGQVRVEIGWYTSTTFEVRTVAFLDWGEWYRFEYLIHLVDGLDGADPNDRFTLRIFERDGTLAGAACGSTWEVLWRTGSYGGGTAPRAVNGFDFASLSGPNGNLAGHLDNFSIRSFVGETLAVTIGGNANVCAGGTTTLTADLTGSDSSSATYAWRDASNNIVGTERTFEAGAGTYTVTVTDVFCATATSSAFEVTEFADLGVVITGSATAQATLTANVSGGSGTVASYTWRNASNAIVGTGPTLLASPGTYTVTVVDASCGTATSAPFIVSPAVLAEVPTASDAALVAMLALFALAAVVRLR